MSWQLPRSCCSLSLSPPASRGTSASSRPRGCWPGSGAGRARGGRPARVRRVPERQADHRHRAVRRLRPGRGAGLRGRRGHRDGVEHLPLAGPVDRLADGRLGRGRHRGRRARALASRPRAQPVPAGRRVRARRSALRRLDGPLPMDARRPPGPRHLPGDRGHVAALQRRPRGRQRGVLPADRPGFIRALARYRRRLEVRWERSPAPAAAPSPSRSCLRCLPSRLPPRRRSAPRATCCRRRTRTAASAQHRLGSSPLYTGWAGLGLGSAGRNPRDVQRRGGPLGRGLRAPRERVARPTSARSSERCCSLGWPASTRATSAGATCSRDREAPARRRLDRRLRELHGVRGDGAARGRRIRRGGDRALAGASQNADGGFGVARASTSDTDMTGATLQALATVGRAHGGAAQRAVSWLRANQNGDGGFGQFKGRASNAQSTAYAIQGLVAAGAGGATLSRARLSRAPAAQRRQRRLLVVERADPGVGDRPGADGPERQAAPDRGGAAEQADAREGGDRRVGRRSSRAGGGGKGGSKRARAPAAQPRGRGLRRSGRAAAGAVAGATAPTEPGATNPEGTSALAAAS